MRNSVKGGALLHSHHLLYPVGSGLQQITTYHHKDDNNYWIIEKPHEILPSEIDPVIGSNRSENIESYNIEDNIEDNLEDNIVMDTIFTDSVPPEFLSSGDMIRLRHVITGRNLHCHSGFHAYLVKSDFEVVGYGNNTLSPDHNDHWVIEVVDIEKNVNSNLIRNVLTQVRFRHVTTGCYLASSKGSLPDWASHQQEVSCELPGKSTDKLLSKNTIWNFETNYHPKCRFFSS